MTYFYYEFQIEPLKITASASFDVPFDDILVGIDAPVAEVGPDAADGVGPGGVNLGNDHRGFVDSGLGEEFSLLAGDETRAPEYGAPGLA